MKHSSSPRLSVGLLVVAVVTLLSWNALSQPAVQAAAFSTGNLVVYRVGDGAAPLVADTGAAVFLDEFTTTAIVGQPPVQSIALPTVDSGANRQLVANGLSNTEGLLTRSVDGQYLLLTGYDAAPGDLDLDGQTAATVNRVVGRVDAAGTIDTSTALTDGPGGNPRSAASTNGTDIWVGGNSGGVRYTTLGATTSTALTTGNIHQIQIFGGQLYATFNTNQPIAAIGAGTPTTIGQTINAFPGISFTEVADPYGFFLADLTAAVAGVDTLYITDDTGDHVEKYSLVSGTWVANGFVALPAGSSARGLIGTVTGTSVTLYGTITTQLYTFTDSSGYNQTINGTYTVLANNTANTAFRGVAFAPAAAQPPTATATETGTTTSTATTTATGTTTSTATTTATGTTTSTATTTATGTTTTATTTRTTTATTTATTTTGGPSRNVLLPIVQR